MAVSAAVIAKLNEQITHELNASQTYLAMACGFEEQGLKMLAGLFREQADEERGHALKILDYVQEVGGKVVLTALPAPHAPTGGVPAAIEAAVKHEERVTQQIHDLVALAAQEKDFAAHQFLQWFVSEQVEEISKMTHLAQMAKMAGPNLLQLEGYVARMKKE